MGTIRIVLLFIRGGLRDRTELAAENLAILEQRSRRLRLPRRDQGNTQPRPHTSPG